MKINDINLFITNIKVIEFSITEITPVIEEVLNNKKEIKKRSKIYSKAGGLGNYLTDFKNPVKIIEYEKLMLMIGNFFANKGYNFTVNRYWTALYNNNSFHPMHTHCYPLDEKNHVNYSSVLYLTSEGGTDFYSPNPTSTEGVHTVKSEVGKMIIFPSNLLHGVIYNDNKNERMIISANLGIFKA